MRDWTAARREGDALREYGRKESKARHSGQRCALHIIERARQTQWKSAAQVGERLVDLQSAAASSFAIECSVLAAHRDARC